MITLLREQCHHAVYKTWAAQKCEKQVPYSKFMKGSLYSHNGSKCAVKAVLEPDNGTSPKCGLQFGFWKLFHVFTCQFLKFRKQKHPKQEKGTQIPLLASAEWLELLQRGRTPLSSIPNLKRFKPPSHLSGEQPDNFQVSFGQGRSRTAELMKSNKSKKEPSYGPGWDVLDHILILCNAQVFYVLAARHNNHSVYVTEICGVLIIWVNNKIMTYLSISNCMHRILNSINVCKEYFLLLGLHIQYKGVQTSALYHA